MQTSRSPYVPLGGLLIGILVAAAAWGQNPITQPPKPHLDPNQKIPKIGCSLSTGKPRKYACEFILTQFEFLNNPQTSLKQMGWGQQSVTLNLSAAKSMQEATAIGKTFRYYTFELSLTFLRIASPAKQTATYLLKLYPRPKGAETTLQSDLAFIKPSAEPAMGIAVGQKQTITVPVQILVDMGAVGGPGVIVDPLISTKAAGSLEIRMYLHNMATTNSLPQNTMDYHEARDFAEWAARIDLSVKP